MRRAMKHPVGWETSATAYLSLYREMTKVTTGEGQMSLKIVKSAPIDGQRPGTSGLRARTDTFMGKHYLENYVQSVFDAVGPLTGRDTDPRGATGGSSMPRRSRRS